MKFKIPVLAFLIFFLSKEIFSYDGEKVVILCILSFIILAYFNSKEALYNVFLNRSEKLKEEYVQLAEKKEKLEKEIRRFWRIFLDLEDQLIEIYLWVRHNVHNITIKFNKNRNAVVFYLIKDQLNLLLKEKLKINQYLNVLILKNTLINFKNIISKNYNQELNYINDLNFYLNKLISLTPQHDLFTLTINKLNINKEFYCIKTKNWVNFNNFFFANLTLKKN